MRMADSASRWGLCWGSYRNLLSLSVSKIQLFSDITSAPLFFLLQPERKKAINGPLFNLISPL